MTQVTLILKTWLGLTVALPLFFAYEIDEQCAWDLYYCDYPYDTEETFHFRCRAHDDCPANFICCSHRCFRHKICQPVRDPPPTSKVSSGTSRTKPEECDVIVSCDVPLPPAFTRSFECHQDDDCPDHHKCCFVECYNHKVCQPARSKPKTSSTKSAAPTEEITTETDTSDSRSASVPYMVTTSETIIPRPSEKSQETSALETTMSTDSKETIIVIETTPIMSITTEEPPIEIKEKPVPTSATETNISKDSEETITVTLETIPWTTEEPPIEIEETPVSTSTSEAIINKISKEPTTEVPEITVPNETSEQPAVKTTIKTTAAETTRKVEEESTINTIYQTENKDLIKTTVRTTGDIEEEDERQTLRGYTTMTTPIGSLKTQSTSTTTTTDSKGLTEAVTHYTTQSHPLVEPSEVSTEHTDLESSGDSEITGDDEDEENEKYPTESTLEEAKTDIGSTDTTIGTTQTKSQRLGEPTKSNNEPDDVEASGDLEIVGDDEDEWIRTRGFTTTTVLTELIKQTTDSTKTTFKPVRFLPSGKTTKGDTESDDFEASGDLEIIGDDEDERREEENRVGTSATTKIISRTSTPLHQTTNGEGSTKTDRVEQVESSGFEASGDMETMGDDEE